MKSVAEQIGAIWAEYYRPRPFLEGSYLVEVLRVPVKHVTSTSFFIVESRVLESTNPRLGPGCFANCAIDISLDDSLATIRKFISTAGDVPITDVDVDAVEYAVSSDNPLAGEKVRVECIGVALKWAAP